MVEYNKLKIGDTLISRNLTKMRIFEINDYYIHLIDEKHYLQILDSGMTDNLMIEFHLYWNDEEDMQWLGNYTHDS